MFPHLRQGNPGMLPVSRPAPVGAAVGRGGAGEPSGGVAFREVRTVR